MLESAPHKGSPEENETETQQTLHQGEEEALSE